MTTPTRCTGCGAPAPAKLNEKSTCRFCDTPFSGPSPETPKEEIKGGMNTYKRLENVILRGDMNTIGAAIDCTIIGNMNTIKRAIRCRVIGDMNTVKSATDTHVKGSMNTIRPA